MRRLLVLLVLPALLLPLLAVPAAADTTGPVLRGARLDGPAVLPGSSAGRVVVDLADPEERGAGLEYVALAWEQTDAAGRVVDWLNAGSYVGQSVARTMALEVPVDRWKPSGTYRLRELWITDLTGNRTTYRRDGTATADPARSTPPPASPVDLTTLDLVVDNPGEDRRSAVVDRVALRSRTVVAGTPAVVTFGARDDVSGVTAFSVGWTGPTGRQVGVAVEPELAPAGLATGVLPLGAEGGLYRATSVSVGDAAGNGYTVLRSSRPQAYPDGADPFEPWLPVDWESLDLEVVAVSPDDEGPVVTAVRREGPAVLHPGDDVLLRYDITDAQGVAGVTADYRDAAGHRFSVYRQCRAGDGLAVDRLPLGIEAGPLELTGLLVVDDLGYQRFYRRDGVRFDNGRGPVPSDVDLRAGDAVVEVGPPSYTGHEHTRFGCPRTPELPLSVPTDVLPDTSVPVTGGVLVDGVPVATGTVAVFAAPAGEPVRLLGLEDVDARGRYATTLRVGRSTTVVARYLGRDGRAGALPGTSPSRLVRVSRPQSLAVSTPRSTVPAGRAIALTGTVSPARAGVAVALQVPTGPGWRTVRRVRTDAAGRAVVTTAPPRGVRRYRLYAEASGGYRAALSRVLTVAAR